MLLSNPYNPDDRVRNEAIALAKAGFEVTILAWDRDCRKPVIENLDNIQIHRIHIKSGYEQRIRQLTNFIRLWLSFVKQAIKLKPYCVHCHDFDTFIPGVFIKFLRHKTKLVFDAHENYYFMMKQTGMKGSWVIKFLERNLTRFADLLISPCLATLSYYKQFSKKQAVVVGNWKDPENYKFQNKEMEETKKKIGINNELVISYIGVLDKERNVIPLLNVIENDPSVFVILGGRGDQLEEITQKTKSLRNVYFPGYIHPDDVPLFTAISDIIYYGFDPKNIFAPYNAPNKLYEALAAGKTLLATDIGGELTLVVKETGCGLLIQEANETEIANAINYLKDNSNTDKFASQAKLAGESKYNWNMASKLLVDAYKTLI